VTDPDSAKAADLEGESHSGVDGVGVGNGGLHDGLISSSRLKGVRGSYRDYSTRNYIAVIGLRPWADSPGSKR
jgi:hypothetical protein